MRVRGPRFREETDRAVREPESVHDEQREEQVHHQGQVEGPGMNEGVREPAAQGAAERISDGSRSPQTAKKTVRAAGYPRERLSAAAQDVEIRAAVDDEDDEHEHGHLRSPHGILLNQAISSRAFRFVSDGGRLAA